MELKLGRLILKLGHLMDYKYCSGNGAKEIASGAVQQDKLKAHQGEPGLISSGSDESSGTALRRNPMHEATVRGSEVIKGLVTTNRIAFLTYVRFEYTNDGGVLEIQ